MRSSLWRKRVVMARDSGKESFRYDDMVELWEISRAGISVALKQLSEECPGGVITSKDGQRTVVEFDYDLLVGDNDTFDDDLPLNIPDWMARETYDAVMERADIDLEQYDIFFSHRDDDWMRQYQRGGVVISVHESGQKTRLYEVTFRVDNCVVIGGF